MTKLLNGLFVALVACGAAQSGVLQQEVSNIIAGFGVIGETNPSVELGQMYDSSEGRFTNFHCFKGPVEQRKSNNHSLSFSSRITHYGAAHHDFVEANGLLSQNGLEKTDLDSLGLYPQVYYHSGESSTVNITVFTSDYDQVLFDTDSIISNVDPDCVQADRFVGDYVVTGISYGRVSFLSLELSFVDKEAQEKYSKNLVNSGSLFFFKGEEKPAAEDLNLTIAIRQMGGSPITTSGYQDLSLRCTLTELDACNKQWVNLFNEFILNMSDRGSLEDAVPILISMQSLEGLRDEKLINMKRLPDNNSKSNVWQLESSNLLDSDAMTPLYASRFSRDPDKLGMDNYIKTISSRQYFASVMLYAGRYCNQSSPEQCQSMRIDLASGYEDNDRIYLPILPWLQQYSELRDYDWLPPNARVVPAEADRFPLHGLQALQVAPEDIEFALELDRSYPLELAISKIAGIRSFGDYDLEPIVVDFFSYEPLPEPRLVWQSNAAGCILSFSPEVAMRLERDHISYPTLGAVKGIGSVSGIRLPPSGELVLSDHGLPDYSRSLIVKGYQLQCFEQYSPLATMSAEKLARAAPPSALDSDPFGRELYSDLQRLQIGGRAWPISGAITGLNVLGGQIRPYLELQYQVDYPELLSTVMDAKCPASMRVAGEWQEIDPVPFSLATNGFNRLEIKSNLPVIPASGAADLLVRIDCSNVVGIEQELWAGSGSNELSLHMEEPKIIREQNKPHIRRYTLNLQKQNEVGFTLGTTCQVLDLSFDAGFSNQAVFKGRELTIGSRGRQVHFDFPVTDDKPLLLHPKYLVIGCSNSIQARELAYNPQAVYAIQVLYGRPAGAPKSRLINEFSVVRLR